MATTYTWAVLQMDAYPEADGETDVVFNVHWSLTGTEAGFVGFVYSSQGVTVDPDAPFVPFDKLTEAQVIGWVQDAMGAERVAELEKNIEQQIKDQIIPPVVTPPLPWAETL